MGQFTGAVAMRSGVTWFDVVLVAIVAIVLPLASAVSGRQLERTARAEQGMVARYLYIIGRSVVLSILVLSDWRLAGRPWTALGLDIPVSGAGRIGFVLVAVLCVYYTYGLLLRPLTPDAVAARSARLDKYRIMPRTRAEFALFPAVGITGSIAEELLYRGLLIGVLAPFAGTAVAVILSAAAFGAAHLYQGWLRGFVRTGMIGLAFGAGYALTGSLWWLICAHVAVSLFADLYARRLDRLSAVLPYAHLADASSERANSAVVRPHSS
jgi:membrane protease YdiL (CAAX protease family)